MGICQNVCAAHITECINTLFCNKIFCLFILFFFNRIFGRQTMAIPPQFAHNMATAHSLVTPHHIFDGGNTQMPPVRQTITKRWPVIERKRMPHFCFIQRFMKNVITAPKFQHFTFQRGEVCLGVCFCICHFLCAPLCDYKKTGAYAPQPRAEARCQFIL